MAEPIRSAYVAFDRYPASKGAGVHIGQMSAELFDHAGNGLLVVLGDPDHPGYEQQEHAAIARFPTRLPNLFDRVQAFSAWTHDLLLEHRDTLTLCHVRDPWGALPVLTLARRSFPVVFEVNGLPSIELSHTRPWLASSTLAKIRDVELRCLRAADALIVPSTVVADLLTGWGVDADRLHLVPNGADPVPPDVVRPAEAPEQYLIYVGALQPWQGVDVLVRAFARLADLPDLQLVICTGARPRNARPLQQLARRLGVADRLLWQFALPPAEVAAWLAHAELSVAPLTACARNLDQGCSPLKILESMAAGTPVVASDLPVVREIMDADQGRLVPADRPVELARALRVLLEYPSLRRTLGDNARARIAETATWEHSRARLREVYRSLTGTETADRNGADLGPLRLSDLTTRPALFLGIDHREDPT